MAVPSGRSKKAWSWCQGFSRPMPRGFQHGLILVKGRLGRAQQPADRLLKPRVIGDGPQARLVVDEVLQLADHIAPLLQAARAKAVARAGFILHDFGGHIGDFAVNKVHQPRERGIDLPLGKEVVNGEENRSRGSSARGRR